MHSMTFSFVHAVIILTVSFFVLSFALKQERQWLKTFGFVIAVLLWVSAALVFGKGACGHFDGDRFGDRHHGDKMMWKQGHGMGHFMSAKPGMAVEKPAPADNNIPAQPGDQGK